VFAAPQPPFGLHLPGAPFVAAAMVLALAATLFVRACQTVRDQAS